MSEGSGENYETHDQDRVCSELKLYVFITPMTGPKHRYEVVGTPAAYLGIPVIESCPVCRLLVVIYSPPPLLSLTILSFTLSREEEEGLQLAQCCYIKNIKPI